MTAEVCFAPALGVRVCGTRSSRARRRLGRENADVVDVDVEFAHVPERALEPPMSTDGWIFLTWLASSDSSAAEYWSRASFVAASICGWFPDWG